jgi:hypothetical protein
MSKDYDSCIGLLDARDAPDLADDICEEFWALGLDIRDPIDVAIKTMGLLDAANRPDLLEQFLER